MVIKLILKDLLLIKHHIIFLILLAISIPAFFSNTTGLNDEFIFTLTVIFTVLSIYQDVSIEEEKYSNATLLLCTLPISRKHIVLSRYLLAFFSYIICIIICSLVTLFLRKNIYLNFNLISQNLFYLLLMLSIFIPIQYSFGYSIVKYIFSITCVSTPFLISYLSRFNIQGDWSSIWVNLMIFIVSFVIYYISYIISCFIFNKRDF